MSLVPNQRPEPGRTPETAQLPVDTLLKWAAAHGDKVVRDHADKARASLEILRTRYSADTELARLDGEAARLEAQLEQLRARRAELNPPKGRAPRSYDAAVVRSWARENGHEVPDRGKVPKKVVDAWKQATGGDGAES